MENFPKHSSPGTKREKLQAEGRPEIGVMDQLTPEALQYPRSEPDPVTSACWDRDPSPGGNWRVQKSQGRGWSPEDIRHPCNVRSKIQADQHAIKDLLLSTFSICIILEHLYS